MSVPSKSLEGVEFHLFTYYRSSCSGRLRIALALKRIPTKLTFVNLIKNGQNDDSYASVNPSKSVPTLHINFSSKPVKITQSIAALEYLDEAFPDTLQLLPPISEPEKRAAVRTLVGIIASDTQPPTNLRILKRARAMAEAAGQDPQEAAKTWAKELMTDGLMAYEAICKDVAGKYSVGDEITMADCCLVPAMWGAERFEVDWEPMPTVRRVYEELNKLEEVKRSHWKNQEDTPEELRQ
jgi:maleylacetoacetate isomerase